LVIERRFDGLRDDYIEISEEFRLFHNLYHDRKADRYFRLDGEGKHLVAAVTAEHVEIRLKEIRHFLAVKRMYLSIQFDLKEFSTYSLAELGLSKGGSDRREPLMCWGRSFGESFGFDKYRTWSRLLGKRLIRPLPKSKMD